MDIVSCLRGLLAVVSLMGLGNAVQCYIDFNFLTTKVYRNLGQSESQASSDMNLASRLFGIWLLLSAAVRFTCAFDIRNKPLYIVTMLSFVLALTHFLTEMFVYGTMHPSLLSPSFLAPLVVCGGSIVAMLVAYRKVFPTDTDDQEDIVKPVLPRKARQKHTKIS